MGNKSGAIIAVIVGICILAILFPIVLDNIVDAQTNPQTDAFPGCVVAAGSTDVVLTEDLYGDRVANVTAMTATGAGAVPVASVYTPATNTLTITGLGADTPQDITVTYLYDRTGDFTGLGAFMNLSPMLIWLGALAALIGGAFFTFKGR